MSTYRGRGKSNSRPLYARREVCSTASWGWSGQGGWWGRLAVHRLSDSFKTQQGFPFSQFHRKRGVCLCSGRRHLRVRGAGTRSAGGMSSLNPADRELSCWEKGATKWTVKQRFYCDGCSCAEFVCSWHSSAVRTDQHVPEWLLFFSNNFFFKYLKKVEKYPALYSPIYSETSKCLILQQSNEANLHYLEDGTNIF